MHSEKNVDQRASGRLDLTYASALPKAHLDMQPEYPEQDGHNPNCYSSGSDQIDGKREGSDGLRHKHPLSSHD